MYKFLWIDCETTGLDPVIHDPIQIAGIIVANGKEEKFNFRCAPTNPDAPDIEGATKIHGITREEMMSYQNPYQTYATIISIFEKYINKYDKKDKFILSGQNVQFDCEMMHQWFKKLNDDYWFSWVGCSHFDLKNLAILYELKTKKRFGSYKLGNICKCLGVELNNGHNAMDDIIATREACQIIWSKITK
jgi:DNA polymerase III alpha subunit (gram-positive type)